MKNSAIGWTQDTHNFWYGCNEIDTGCVNCYAKRIIEGQWQKNFNTLFVRDKRSFDLPKRWKKGRVIFPNSLSDFFHPGADKWRDDAWDVIRKTPQHLYLILTKRVMKIRPRLPEDWGEGWKNVWLGMSASNDQILTSKAPILFNIPAQHYFLSNEPALGYLDNLYNFLRRKPDLTGSGFDWVITGGESDLVNSRPFKPDWAIEAKKHCDKNGTPFFFKQHGGKYKIDDVWGGDKLAGERHQNFPPEIAKYFSDRDKEDSQIPLL